MKIVLALLAAVALCHVQAAPHVPSTLFQTLATKGTADIMVIMKDPVAPLVASINKHRFASSAVKTTSMVNQLREFTGRMQKNVLSFLSKRTMSGQVKPFWITNRISVKNAAYTLVQDLMTNFGGEIAEIREAKVIHLEDTEPVPAPEPKAIEWGVDMVQAPLAWAEGITGKGVVVAGIDTGVRLRPSYNWYDATSTFSQAPADTFGHGTHVMGTIAGKNGTGVAPDSEWIHCRAYEALTATEEAFLTCGQWITCPTLPDGREEDCSQKPDVVSNSWSEGHEDPYYNDVINAWQAANIVPVFSIGNLGPECRTAKSPGDQPNVISVGATNAQNHITSFSSRGPSQVALRIKPDFSAPGNNVRSASIFGDNVYVYLSGTSMACPHVAGTVALLRQKNPNATFDEIVKALQTTAFRPELDQLECTGGDVNATYPWPNNAHGYGNVRVHNALGALN